tara:strand:- start:243 stop:419 length:177 start_codon:yes stop_codon:yes gene_type:complete
MKNIQVGNLVKWNHPEKKYQDYGIVIKVDGMYAHIRWLEEPDQSGNYRRDCELLEVVK